MSSKRYFGGSTVKGLVRQLKATTFKQLCEHYFNTPVSKKFNRKEFHSYDSETAKIAKDGPFVTAAVFNVGEDGECDRSLANCTACTLALLDFDSLSDKDRADGFVDYAEQFYEAPEFVRDRLYPFNFVFYETISSKPGARRVRILLDLQEMPVHMHKLAVLRAADLLGVLVNRWKGRVESMTLPLPMFRPVQFADEPYAAILADRTDGSEMEELDIPDLEEGLDDDSDRTYAYQGKFDDDDLMNVPVAGITFEQVREILSHLDADKSRGDWIKVAMALRHQFRSEDDARQAFEAFNQWSSEGKGNKYVDTEATYKTWNSFKPDPERRRPTTIRTVFEMAKEAGWDYKPMAKQVKRTVGDWIKRQVDPDELTQHGPGKIASMPFRDDVTEEALIMDLQARIKELGNKTIMLPILRKAVKKCRRQKANDENPNTPDWVRPWVYITTRNVMRHMVLGTELSPEAFNRTFARELMSDAPDSDSAATGRPPVQPMDYVLNMLKWKTVDGTTYDPRENGEEPYFEYEGQWFLNEYRISTVPKCDPAKSEAAGKIFSEAVLATVGPEHHKLIMDFFAHILQRPGKLIRWMPLVQSGQGSGKNMLCKCVGAALGMANFKSVNAKYVIKDFNAWIYGAQFINIDEIKITGKTKAEIANALKDIITNDEVSLEKKGQDLKMVENIACKFANTNWQDAIYLEDSDRRWLPIKSPLQTKEQILALTATGHFKRLAKLYKNGGALRQFLLDWEIDKDFPTDGPAPDSAFRKEMILESKNGMQDEIEDAIENEKLPTVGSDVIFMPHLVSVLTSLKDNHKPSHFLKLMQFSPWKPGSKFVVGGVRGPVWIHDTFDQTQDPLLLLKERNDLDIEID
jgi:hypothetical protein